MKKLIMLLGVGIVLSSCSWTTVAEDTQMLQKKYPTVYRITEFRYICIDSANVYDVRVAGKGYIESTIKIK